MMVSYLVLMKPRPHLTASARTGLVYAFERAVREIPTVRDVRIGRRIAHGAGHEAFAPDTADYLAMIDFDDLADSRRTSGTLRTSSSARGSGNRSVPRWCTTSRWEGWTRYALAGWRRPSSFLTRAITPGSSLPAASSCVRMSRLSFTDFTMLMPRRCVATGS